MELTLNTRCSQKKPIPIALRPHRPVYGGAKSDSTGAEIRRILRGPRLQAKLTIGAPNDIYEQEADRVVGPVSPAAPSAFACSVKGPKHRGSDGEDATGVCVHHNSQETMPQIQRLTHCDRCTDEAIADFANHLGAGVPLDTTSRGYFEPRFGCDFANIRIHRGTQAAAAAASIQARAFALGRDLVFAAGEYEPQSADGRRLLAHELTHVVQQSGVKGIRGADKPGSSQGRYEYFHLGKVSPEKIYRAEPQPTPSSLPFERVGNEAGIAGAKGAAERLERLVIGTTVARALATIPITDAAQKRVVIQHVQNSPATLRAIAEQDKVRFLSQQEYETGIEFLGFPSGADAFADSKNGFLYITPHGTPSAFTMGHEVSHIQTGPVGGDSADPAFSIALGNLNLEIRAAFVDYAILKLATLHENLAAGMTEEQAVAGFAQVYSSTILDYIVDHGSVESTLGKLAKEVSRRRSVEHVPQNIDELKKAVAKGYVSEADLVLIFSPEAPEIEHYVEPFEIEGL